jgi:hypothetical protein
VNNEGEIQALMTYFAPVWKCSDGKSGLTGESECKVMSLAGLPAIFGTPGPLGQLVFSTDQLLEGKYTMAEHK